MKGVELTSNLLLLWRITLRYRLGIFWLYFYRVETTSTCIAKMQSRLKKKKKTDNMANETIIFNKQFFHTVIFIWYIFIYIFICFYNSLILQLHMVQWICDDNHYFVYFFRIYYFYLQHIRILHIFYQQCHLQNRPNAIVLLKIIKSIILL